MAIGVVAIIFGVLGMVSGLWGTVAPFIMHSAAESLRTNTPPAGQGPDPAAMLDAVSAWRVSMSLASAVAMAVAVLLLIAGIGLVQRRSWGVRAAKTWAWMRVLTAVWIVGVSAMAQRDQMAAAIQGPGAPPGMPAFMLSGVAAGVVVLGLLWAWALPAFMLVWFRTRSVKAEIAGWRQAVPRGVRFGRPPMEGGR